MSDTLIVDAGREVVPGQFTLVHFQRVFASALTKKMFLLPLRNTMIITLGLTITALFIGSLLAWVMVRSNLPGERAQSLPVAVTASHLPLIYSRAWLLAPSI